MSLLAAENLGDGRPQKEYVARREQLGVLKLIGKIEFDPAYCYKDARRR